MARAGKAMTVGVVLAASVAQASETCRDFTSFDVAALERLDLDAASAMMSEDTRAALSAPRPTPLHTGVIRIVQQPIFDTHIHAEDRPLYRWANRVHIDTRPQVLRDIVLFAPGEPVTLAQLEESERLLRAKPYLYDARVLPRRLCGDRVDVDVVTRDVWTLLPRINFDRAGGANSYGIGLSDPNVLGTGKNVSVGYSKDEDRSGVDFFYADPNVRGTRGAFAVFLEDNDDGDRQLVDVRRPFYSLAARYAVGLRVDNFDRQDALYLLNEKTSEFRHETLFSELSGGWSAGRRKGHVQRWYVGYTYDDTSFEPLPGIRAPDPFPEDRRYAYPWVGFESIEERFERMRNFDRFQRIEDLNMGRRWSARLGWSDEAFGGDDDSRLVVRGGFQDTNNLGPHQLFRYGFDLSGFWNFDADEEEDVVTHAYGVYNRGRSEKRAFAASLGLTYVRNLPEDKQLLLGGDTGMRGYPTRYQAGDKRFVLTLEERFFTDWYPLQLARVGYVVFADVGRAWESDTPNDDEFGVLANLGVGLRLEAIRTRRDQILHFDLAFPLVDGRNVSAVELTFRVRASL